MLGAGFLLQTSRQGNPCSLFTPGKCVHVQKQTVLTGAPASSVSPRTRPPAEACMSHVCSICDPARMWEVCVCGVTTARQGPQEAWGEECRAERAALRWAL